MATLDYTFFLFGKYDVGQLINLFFSFSFYSFKFVCLIDYFGFGTLGFGGRLGDLNRFGWSFFFNRLLFFSTEERDSLK